MRIQSVFTAVLMLFSLNLAVGPAMAESSPAILEQSMSAALDLWRDGHFDQLFEQLAHRGKMSKEQFVKKMRAATIRPVCCFQKLEGFKVLNEKRTEATVYARIGLEGPPDSSESSTREFKLSHEENCWKMQLNDVISISGASGKKNKHTSRKRSHTYP